MLSSYNLKNKKTIQNLPDYIHTASISIGFRTMAMKTISFNICMYLLFIIPSASVVRHRNPLTILSSRSPPTSSCIHLRSNNNNILIVRVQGELTELWRVYMETGPGAGLTQHWPGSAALKLHWTTAGQ